MTKHSRVRGRRRRLLRRPLLLLFSLVLPPYAARRDLFGDAFNEAVFMRPGQWLTRSLVWFDNRVIDGFVNGSAALIGGGSARLRRWQTGFVRSYALSMLAGAVLVVGVLVLVRL